MLADLVGGEVVDVGLAGLDQVDGPVVELVEVVGGEVEMLAPVEAEPADVFLDRVDVLLLFLDRVGVVEAQVAAAAELLGDPEVERDRLGVADVEVAVRLGREAGHDLRDPALAHVGGDDLADEVASFGRRCYSSLEEISAAKSTIASYTVNERAMAHAKQLIDARQYVVRSVWNEVQPRAADENAFLKSHSWAEYAAWHLALTEGAPDETKARYAFVFGDFRRVHRMGLIACSGRFDPTFFHFFPRSFVMKTPTSVAMNSHFLCFQCRMTSLIGACGMRLPAMSSHVLPPSFVITMCA